MKAVILAGGYGTRLGELTHEIPKPMVPIGGKPILWHIMKLYHAYGISEFVICCGYRGYVIKEYFENYMLHMSDVTFDYQADDVIFHRKGAERWRVTLVDTGQTAMTGGRLLAVKEYLSSEDCFLMTYGDGVADIDIGESIEFHKRMGCLATMTVAAPPGRFGAVELSKEKVKLFQEKPSGDGALVNAGYFILSPRVLSYIEDDQTIWEQEPLQNLAKDGQLAAYTHSGFWQPMDTLRDKNYLETKWKEGAPWKIW